MTRAELIEFEKKPSFKLKAEELGWKCEDKALPTDPYVRGIVFRLEAVKNENKLSQNCFLTGATPVRGLSLYLKMFWKQFYQEKIKPQEEKISGCIYLTFSDLEFQPHESFVAVMRAFNPSPGDDLYERYKNMRHAVLDFPNGYGISVICGNIAYAMPGHYEISARYNGQTDTSYVFENGADDKTEEEITAAMIELQKLKP